MKRLLIFALLTLLTVTACATSNRQPTPTIVPLERPEGDEAAAQIVDRPPTVTPIPPPSPTPTATPLIISASPVLTAASDLPAAEAAPQAEVLATALNIRQGPGLDYPVLGVAQAGDRFEVVGTTATGDWLQIASGSEPGWISGHMAYTRLLAGDLGSVPLVQAPPPPDLSPQNKPDSGGRLVFMTGSGGELYVANLDGSGLRRLAGGVIDPVVSPDGRQVAFTRWDGAEFGTVYVIDIDGSGERAVARDLRQAKSPTWSPDGRQIAFSYQYGGLRDPEEVCRHYGLGQKISLPARATYTSFGVGRDGVNVCYIPFEDLHWKLARVDVQSGAFEDLPSDEYSYNPTWDPQNPWRVIYDGSRGLVQLDVTNGNRWPITKDLRDTGPLFSPDGQMVALTYKQHDHWEVYTYQLETGQRLRLTKPPILADPQYNSAAPAWSPDGSKIAFVTDRTGQWEIWVMNVDGSQQRPLFDPDTQAQLNLQYHGVNERMLNWIE